MSGYTRVPRAHHPHPYTDKTPFLHPHATLPPTAFHRKKPAGLNPWIKYGVPVAIVAVIALVFGAIFGAKGSKRSASPSATAAAAPAEPSETGPTEAIATATNLLAAGRFATATDSKYMIPVYPTAVSKGRV